MTIRHLSIPSAVIAVALAVPIAPADAPPGPYFNGFEQNTAGWFNNSGGTIRREPSFYSNGGGYADGIESASGNFHARLGLDPNPALCASGGGPRPVFSGPFTNWGGFSSIFPPGGYQTRVDVYLDVAWAAANFDRRFDWSSAVNNTSGTHRRDFVFNAGTEPTGFVISASNNGNRCNSFPNNPGRMPIHIVVSGWYTFEHTFAGVAGGPLVVVMRVIHKATNAEVGTWALSDPSDIIGVTVGGNRYGWFIQNEIDDLAIDNSERTGTVSTPGCEVHISAGGWIMTLSGDKATFGGNAKVSLDGEADGQMQYQDHGPVQPLTVHTINVQAVVCSDDRTQATLVGQATVDGFGEHEYKIDLEDVDEPGTSDKYEILIPSVGYYSGRQTLMGGNVQIK